MASLKKKKENSAHFLFETFYFISEIFFAASSPHGVLESSFFFYSSYKDFRYLGPPSRVAYDTERSAKLI